MTDISTRKNRSFLLRKNLLQSDYYKKDEEIILKTLEKDNFVSDFASMKLSANGDKSFGIEWFWKKNCIQWSKVQWNAFNTCW